MYIIADAHGDGLAADAVKLIAQVRAFVADGDRDARGLVPTTFPWPR